jgi:phosphatidate cytidylyltransferase
LDNFFRRTITGVWIVIFVLGGFWLHPVTFFITGLIIIAGAQYEYLIMVKSTGIRPQIINGIISGLILYIISTLVAAGIIEKTYFLVLLPFMAYILIAELYRKGDRPFDSLAHTFFAVIYIALPFSFFPFSAFSRSGLSSLLPHGILVFSPGIIIGFFLILWANDTAAYIMGVSLGRNKLMERISPKKSWEGFIGGTIVSIAVAWLLSGWLGVVDSAGWIVIALLISITGTFGDLIESMLKRSIGVKDSGSAMPGHGGFLDRFDSTIVSFPLVYLFIVLFG